MSDTPPATAPTRAGGERGSWFGRWLTIAIPALVAYVPLLLTQPGIVGADTKTYLYLDPAKLLRSTPYVWDSQIGLGTITHQNIGYLFPMGPFYLLFQSLGFPDWAAQRIWLGSVLFLAALGVRYLLLTLDWHDEPGRRGGLLVASLAYMLSPYVLQYEARISVILLPWTALPWLIAFTARAVRNGGWRYPAWFALTVLLVGGINATALILVGVGPLLWVLYAVFVEREERARDAIAAAVRIGALTLLTSLWWIAGLWAEGRFGLPVLRYTETYRTVATVSQAPELLRGLGYWFFYGRDKLGPWIEPSVEYTNRTWVLALSFLIPTLALVCAAFVRWRHRAYFAVLAMVGTVIAVAAHPWDDPSFLGGIFKALSRTDAGLSMRSTPRAGPLIVLSLAVFLGVGVDALGRAIPRLAVPVAGFTCLLLAANLSPLWNGTMVAQYLQRPEDIPQYWLDAAEWLQNRDDGTRVLEIPGADFAAYRWGNTVDPVTPGLMTRPYVARELFQWGSPPSANVLIALDRRLHEDTFDPDALAPISRLLGVGDVVTRNDLQYERYRLARPRQLWQLIRSAPGLGAPVTFGADPYVNVPPKDQALDDEVELGTPNDLPWPPAVAAFPVEDPVPMVHAMGATQPLVLAGDGEGVVDAAGVGLLDPRQALFYSASFATDRAAFDRILGQGADLLVTDTNRKRSRRWGTLRENTGYTERADETLPYDPTDQRIDVFPGTGSQTQTVSVPHVASGAAAGAVATASSYGNPITYTPDDRPMNVLDGDPQSAWRTGALDQVYGEHLDLALDRPVRVDQVRVLQPVNLQRNRWITRVRLELDGPDGPWSEEYSLDESSRAQPGAVLTFPERTITSARFTILDTNQGARTSLAGASGVGFAEITFPGVGAAEVIRPPTDLLDATGTASTDHRLSLLFTRLRSNPREPVRLDEEPAMVRLVRLPATRSFQVGAFARVSAYLPDTRVDQLLGIPTATEGGVTAQADVRLPGDLRQRAMAAIDGDPRTAWTTIYQDPAGHWVQYTTPTPITFDHLDLQVVADGRHSVPLRVTVMVDGTPYRLEVPPITDATTPGATTTVRLDLPEAVTGSTIGVVIDHLRPVTTVEWYSGGQSIYPVSIAEVGIPGIQAPATPTTFDTGCRADLLTIDGTPVPLRITGTAAEALDRQRLSAEPCGPDGGVVTLGPGDHVVRTAIGRDLGIDLDQVLLRSERGGGPLAISAGPDRAEPLPPAVLTERGRVSSTLQVQADRPFWVVSGQSYAGGWQATADGKDLGPPTLIDGYTSGWLVEPSGPGPVTVHIEWRPQRLVWVLLGLSAFGVVLCGLAIVFGRRRERPTPPLPARAGGPVMPELAPPWRGADPAGDDPPVTSVDRNRALWASAGTVVFVGLNTPLSWAAPVFGIVTAGLTWLVLRRPGTRRWVALAGAAALGFAGAATVVLQFRYRYAPDFSWPVRLAWLHPFGLAAVFLLALSALPELRRPERPTAPPPGTDAGGPNPD